MSEAGGDLLRFTILGCGSSAGVPRIGGDWGDCDPSNPKNRRRRCSLLVERIGPQGVTTAVVDTSPDFRLQMLDADVRHLDGVLYTHEHADHVHGIDDLRAFAIMMRKRVDIYASSTTLERLNTRFGFYFATPEDSFYPPILNPQVVEPFKPVTIEGQGGPIRALPVPVVHGRTATLGFRFGAQTTGGLAYCPDISDLEEASAERLSGLECWIVDALQYKPHISHWSVGQALEWIERLKAERAVLTHMHIPLDYDKLRGELPSHVKPAYDGMTIEIPAS